MAVMTRKTIFIHNPKCGGGTVRHALERAGLITQLLWPPHMGLDGLEPWYGRRLIFGHVRHPVGWLRSRWCYARHRRETDNTMPESPDGYKNPMGKLTFLDFPDFVQAVIDKGPNVVGSLQLNRLRHQGRQAEYIGRTETLLDDVVHALREAGEEFDEQVLREQEDVRRVGRAKRWRRRTEIPADLEQAVCENEPELMEFYQ